MLATNELYEFPEETRIAFIKAMLVVAGLDGKFDLAESSFIQQVMDASGLNEEQLREAGKVLIDTPSIDETIIGVVEPKARRLLIQQLILLSFVDGDYHYNEREKVRHAARLFRFRSSWVESLEDWAAAGLDWRNRGQELMSVDPQRFD